MKTEKVADGKLSDIYLPLIVIVVVMVAVFGCRRYHTQQPEPDTATQERQQKETLMRINRQLVDKDAKKIADFAKHKGWKMQVSESGLWYMVYEHGKGIKATTDKVAEVAYTISLLDSTICYSSEQSGMKTFRLGQGGVESGLEEGVLLMHVGDKARFIMPPHLAHGLTGDDNCIPPRTIILYEVELLELK